MATNLRLRHDAEEALRTEARRSGRSQQDVIRAAVDRYLGLGVGETPESDLAAVLASGGVHPPRTAFRKARRRIAIPSNVTSEDLLNRDDRF